MLEELKQCQICPRDCKVNRNLGKIGNCKASNKIEIALVSLHKYEEPCISGENGSGTIFLHIAICIVFIVKIMKLVRKQVITR